MIRGVIRPLDRSRYVCRGAIGTVTVDVADSRLPASPLEALGDDIAELLRGPIALVGSRLKMSLATIKPEFHAMQERRMLQILYRQADLLTSNV